MTTASPILASAPFGDTDVSAIKDKTEFRNYVNSSFQDRVARTYYNQHTYQTYDYVMAKRQQYASLNSGLEMTIWDAAEMLNDIVDESDPDVDNPQINHLLQTAEAIRKAYPGEEWDWFHLTGFIHDLGKLLLHPRFAEPQWAVVGDTFPVGCRFHEANIFSEFFKNNPDFYDPRYSTDNGIYQPGCGLDDVVMCWGHDEYMYQICLGNNCKLPLPALYMIRYHSFYPWHRHGAYTQLTNAQDVEMLKWVLEFNKFDLYSKDPDPVDVDELKPYYQKISKKYFPDLVKF
jgi:inositol oxygenase